MKKSYERELVEKELALHVKKSHVGAGLAGGRFDYCDKCSGHPRYPCGTVVALRAALRKMS
jgi:hypothetical protein